MSAQSVIEKAAAQGIALYVAGGRIRGRGAKPDPAFLAGLRTHEAEIVALLQHEAAIPGSVTPAATPPVPAISPPPPDPRPVEIKERGGKAPAIPREEPPPMNSPPLGVSRALASALNAAEHFHVGFRIEDGLLITQPPQDYRREVQAAERALMERREEIKTICHWSRRPKGYSDANWVRAVVDSCRLGYNLWREG